MPILIASIRKHKSKIAVASVSLAFALAILYSPRFGFPAIPPILAFPVWIGLLVWSSAGTRSEAKPEAKREAKRASEPKGEGVIFGFLRKLFAPRIVIASKQDAEDFETLLRARNKEPSERTPAEQAAHHRFTLTQIKHSGDAKAQKIAADIEEAEKTIADMLGKALREAQKDGRI